MLLEHVISLSHEFVSRTRRHYNVLHVFIATTNTTTTSQTTPPEVTFPHSVERCITDGMQQYSER